MWFNVFLFVVGLTALVVGADVLVRGASKLALSIGISPLVVGLTIVALGTSAPEMAVSTGAVLKGQTDIAVGNVVGSNIFNILVVLGLSALITPLVVHLQIIRQELPIMVGAVVLLLVMGWDGQIAWYEAALFLVLTVLYTVFLIVQSRRETAAAAQYSEEIQAAEPGAWDAKLPVQMGLIAAGLVLMVFGSDWLVSSAVFFARSFGVSELVIALTIVAAGTSMPEVATSVVAAIKGRRDIAVGNVVGSCIFNVLGCIGLSGVVAGTTGLVLAPSVMAFDMWVMLAVSVACLPVFLSGREIARWEGGVFLGYYVAYLTYLILVAQQHAALRLMEQVMMGVVVPLTVVALVASLIRRPSTPA